MGGRVVNRGRSAMIKPMLGVFRYEYRMMFHRRGLWLAFGVVYLLHALSMLRLGDSGASPFAGQSPWKTAGELLFVLNVFAPLIGGIAAADRLIRDSGLGVRELQRSAPLKPGAALFAKYAGVLAGALTPNLLYVLLIGGALILTGAQTAAFMPAVLAAYASITLPAFAFVVAFSLACPLILPIRVYQILFTGYWFWGNYLNSSVIPTLNGTLLTPSGTFVLQGFFGGRVGPAQGALHGPLSAAINLAVLFALAAAALWAAAAVSARRDSEA